MCISGRLWRRRPAHDRAGPGASYLRGRPVPRAGHRLLRALGGARWSAAPSRPRSLRHRRHIHRTVVHAGRRARSGTVSNPARVLESSALAQLRRRELSSARIPSPRTGRRTERPSRGPLRCAFGRAVRPTNARWLQRSTTTPINDLTSEFQGNAPKLYGDKQRGKFSPKLGFRGGHPRNLQGPLLECQNGTRNAEVGQPGEAQAHINEHLKDHSDAKPVAHRIACPLFTCSRWLIVANTSIQASYGDSLGCRSSGVQPPRQAHRSALNP